ncbi:MAG TPA: alpha/beta fold hydrolase [Candidatus Sulfotelmatobacter sp.]|nr:alpha/beta fold hydrolase [Candidatus Sulfotelmatobacter sp.]
MVVIPGFLCPDAYLIPLRNWLTRIGYQTVYSGIRFNAECPNLLIQRQVNQAIDKALEKTGRKVHLIGHSLGGIMAHAVAGQRSGDVASVTTLGAPLKGMVAHSTVLFAAEKLRHRIIRQHGSGVLPECYTARCACDFANSVRRCLPPAVLQTAVFTEDDGVLDWRYCKTNQRSADFAVRGTHIGLVFNPSVYKIIGDRLAKAASNLAGVPKVKAGRKG